MKAVIGPLICMAAEQYWPDLMKDLLRFGADTEARDNRGRTPFDVQRRDPILEGRRLLPAEPAPAAEPEGSGPGIRR